MYKPQLLIVNLTVTSLLIILVYSYPVLAQDDPFNHKEKEKPIVTEWVQKDLEGIASLLKLTPVENQNTEFFKEHLPEGWHINTDTKLGFSGNRLNVAKSGGYTTVSVDILTFNNQIAYYEISVDGSSTVWTRIREQIIDGWKKNDGPEFTEKDSELTYQKKFDNVFYSYERAVGAELGEIKPISVPEDLKDAYEYLISPLNNSIIGEGGCGLGGSVLEGKTSIDALIGARRIDLIENVLKGYNPGGRIYAAIALARMKKQGLKLRPEVTAVLNKVINLNVPASTCGGCILNGGRRAKDIVEEFMKYEMISPE